MKGLDYVIKKTTADLKMEAKSEDVKKLLTAFWEEVEQQVIHLESTTVSIKKLGVFTVSKLKVRTFIKKTIKKIRDTRNMTYSEDNKQRQIANQTKKLRNALKHRNIIAQDYAEKFGNI
jgi:hypothetical protein